MAFPPEKPRSYTPAAMTTIKDRLWARIEQLGDHASFAELQSVEGFQGEYDWCFPDYNLLLWPGLSRDAIEALTRESCGSADSLANFRLGEEADVLTGEGGR